MHATWTGHYLATSCSVTSLCLTYAWFLNTIMDMAWTCYGNEGITYVYRAWGPILYSLITVTTIIAINYPSHLKMCVSLVECVMLQYKIFILGWLRFQISDAVMIASAAARCITWQYQIEWYIFLAKLGLGGIDLVVCDSVILHRFVCAFRTSSRKKTKLDCCKTTKNNKNMDTLP